MANTALSSEKCGGGCGLRLAVGNTNPDRLCGGCQAKIGYTHRGEGSRYARWVAAGRPALEVFMQGEKVRTVHRPTKAERKLPEPEGLPTQYLIQCHRELKRRAAKLEQEAKLLKTYMGE